MKAGFIAATRGFIALACCLVASSCTVGPNYQRPTDVAPRGGFKSPTTQPASTAQIPANWWTLFNDPQLNQLEEQATAANNDLRAAYFRVEQARQAARISYSDFYPTINFDPTIDRARTPGDSTGFVANGTSGGGGIIVPPVTTSKGTANSEARTGTTIRIPFDLTYEVDIWGKIRRGFEAAQAQVRASKADYIVVLQTLQADVATDYFSLRALDLQQDIYQKTTESFRKQVDLTNQQFAAGIIARLDVAQAQAQLSSAISQQDDILRQRADLEHALAVLIGRTPAEVDVAIRPLDLSPPIIPPGMPGDVLRRRPDVAQAEQNLIAANAQVGQAVAAFYPALQLTGTAGFESFNVKDALDWEQRIWSLGAGLTLPVFEGGRLRAAERQARARYDELLATYRGTILGAVRDVEDSLTDLRLRGEQAAAQEDAVRASQEYVDLAQREYTQGITGYLTVIDAERTLLSNQVTAAQILNQRLNSTVLLIKSLGGAWSTDQIKGAE